MRLIKVGDVLAEPAEALIYSTNVMLNCTGGVAAGLVERYGLQVQQELHALLRQRAQHYGQQGEVIQHVCRGMPYRLVFHTLPCDGWYHTTPTLVADVLRRSLAACVQAGGIERVALSALATGYGHLDFDDFIRVADQVLGEAPFASIPRVTVCLTDAAALAQAQRVIVREGLRLQVVDAT